MAKLAGFPDATFFAMERIRETTLVRFDSLFSSERKLWTLQNLRRFHALFVERFDRGEGSFLEKWRTQLDEADDDILQLAAELLYVQQFFTSLSGPEKKLENVTAVLNWCSHPVQIPEWAVLGVKRGLAGDRSFNQHRPFHLAWLNEFLIHWHGISETERKKLLSDPWSFAQEVRGVEFSEGAYQPVREAWLYIIFPDAFENISSRRDKRQIRDAFKDRLSGGPSENIDADLLEIRNQIATQEGAGFHFYRSPIIEQWREEKGKRVERRPSTAPEAQGTATVDQGLDANELGSLSDLAAELFLEPPEVLGTWVALLKESRQLIFQGPPGTGKTLIARKLATIVSGHKDRVELVQFHPSYAYEDFVEGFRPGGAGTFTLKPGPLKRLAERATGSREHTFVLVIDEINRANLAKVFGELYYLLEYRGEAISLQYSEERFQLPPNVLIIGTMNTADRSIALLDMAIRRRFRFVDLFPDRPPLGGVLRRFLDRKAPDMAFLADMLDDVNQQLNDPHASIGPSHFLVKDTRTLTEERAQLIWNHSILPALADRFFDTPSELEYFAYHRVRSRATPDESASGAASYEGDG